MTDQLRQQALLEIALSLGGESDPERLLNSSLPLIVRRSASTSAGVVCIADDGWETTQVTPGALSERQEWRDLAERAVVSAGEHDQAAWRLAGTGAAHHVFRLRGFGVLVVSRPAPFDDPFVRAFIPVAEVLARPLVADLEQRRRRAAELDLSRMGHRQQGLLDALPFAAWLEDTTGRFTEVNAAFEAWTGQDRDAIIERLPTEILPGDLGASYLRATWEVLRTGQPATEQEFDHDSGQIHEQQRVPYRDPQGDVHGVVGFRREVTEQVENLRRLNDQGKFQQMVMGLAVGFVNTPLERLPVAIDAALARTGEFVAVDRAYVFEYDFEANTTSNTYEWCAFGVEPAIDDLQGVPLELVPDWVETHKRGELMYVPDVQALPIDSGIRQVLEPQGVQTLIALPLFAEGRCLGFVGFDSVRVRKEWTDGELQLLRVLSELFVNSELRRRRDAALLAAQRETDQARGRLELALQASNDAIWEWDLVTDQVYYSSALFRMVGRDDPARTGPIGLFRELIHPDHSRRFEAAIDALRSSDGQRVELRTRLAHTLGHEVPVLIRGAVFNDDQGTAIRMAGTLADLTQQMQAQAQAERRLQLESTMARISARFVNFEGFDEAVDSALADLGDRYGASRSYVILLDHAAGLADNTHEWCAPGVSSTLEITQAIPTESLSGLMAPLLQGEALVIDDVEDLPAESLVERELLSVQGIRSVLALPLMVGGRLEGLIGLDHVERTAAWSLEDATLLRAAAELIAGALARSRAEQQLVEALQRAEVASRAKTRFLSTISHELRTPMNGVLGMTELLLESPLEERQRGYVAAARSSADALLTLFDELLDVARIESGKVTLDRQATDLSAIVEAVAEAARLATKAGGPVLEVRIAPSVPTEVWADPGRVRQIMANLVGNAVKFTLHGTVTIGLERLDDPTSDQVRLRLTVRDTGVGIPEEALQTIFEPFVQAAPVDTRRVGGSGLGLAIVKELIGMMDGTVHIDSTVGIGTTVTAELRFEEVTESPANAAEIDRSTDLAARNLRILLAEDNLINQEVFRGFLHELGGSVEVVDDGGAAIDAHAAGTYDIVLMDCFMPDVDGLTATRAIRAREVGTPATRTPILAVTADASADHAAACRAAGMDDVLIKPCDRAGLFAAMDRLLPPRDPVATPSEPPRSGRIDGGTGAVTTDGVASVPAAAVEGASPVLDPSALRTLSAQTTPDGPLAHRLLALFAEHGPIYLEELLAGVEHADRPRIRVAAHTLKSNAATLGLRRLTDACRNAEALAKPRAATDAEVALEDLVRAVAVVEQEFHDGLAALDTARSSGTLEPA